LVEPDDLLDLHNASDFGEPHLQNGLAKHGELGRDGAQVDALTEPSQGVYIWELLQRCRATLVRGPHDASDMVEELGHVVAEGRRRASARRAQLPGSRLPAGEELAPPLLDHVV